MANKYSGYAAVLQVSIAAVFTDIAAIRDISGPSMSAEPIDVSSRDLGWKEYIVALRDAGEVTFDVIYDPDTVTHSATAAGGFITLLSAAAINLFKIKFSDATPMTATFSALVVKVTPKGPLNGAQTADVTLKVTGAITWA